MSLDANIPLLGGPKTQRPASGHHYDIRGPMIAGFVIIAIMFGGFGVWSAMAELARGIRAPGQVVIQTERQQIDHLEGGIVQEVLVKEDEQVVKGQPLVRLDVTQARSQIEQAAALYDQSMALEARLVAELANAETITFPQSLRERANHEPRIREMLHNETELFKARRNELAGTVSIYEQRVDQLKRQIVGFEAQLTSTKEQSVLIKDELDGLRTLLEKGYVPMTRVRALERVAAQLEGQQGELQAKIAAAEVQIGEARMQIEQQTKAFNRDLLDQLQQIRTKITQLEAQMSAARDRIERGIVRAPHAGTVMGLKVHTIGASVGSGETLMYVVPDDETLVIDTLIEPKDIEYVHVGMPVDVRVSFGGGGKMGKRAPLLHGEVTRVSPDVMQAPDGRSFYTARLTVGPEEWDKLGDHKVMPGMQADILFKAGSRTLLDYIVRPISMIFESGFTAP